eukprot:GSChrysophyteH1.ASY1.ANO1.2075.1 assembled CDS
MEKHAGRQTTTPSKSKQKGPSPLRLCLEGIFFLGWLFCTGVLGYFVGHTQRLHEAQADCPPVSGTIPMVSGGGATTAKPPCKKVSGNERTGVLDKMEEEVFIDGSYTLDELERLWSCSHAEATDIKQVNQQIFPKENNLDKTKWKSILTVEPKAFFDKYLQQYPGDTRAAQPVVVFSHKELNKFEDIDEVCKVVDVAIVPDTPGVCVAVTETFHDVASYHMLHADKQKDGTFALTSNSVDGRVLPEDIHYAAARALLLEFFSFTEVVNSAVKGAPKFGQGKVAIAVLLECEKQLELFQNSVISSEKVGISKSKFVIFTTSASVAAKAKEKLSAIKLIDLRPLQNVGKSKDMNKVVTEGMRRRFLTAWLAYAVAASGNKMLWQSPGTLWFARPDDIVKSNPVVETLWAYKGRNDVRAAPFFNSMDFFVATGAERSVHLLHEIVLHFDLVLAWDSLDALSAYRLAENNARYGTTSHLLAPYDILHTELMGHQPKLLRNAVDDEKPPRVMVVPTEGISAAQAKKMLQAAELWFL